MHSAATSVCQKASTSSPRATNCPNQAALTTVCALIVSTARCEAGRALSKLQGASPTAAGPPEAAGALASGAAGARMGALQSADALVGLLESVVAWGHSLPHNDQVSCASRPACPPAGRDRSVAASRPSMHVLHAIPNRRANAGHFQSINGFFKPYSTLCLKTAARFFWTTCGRSSGGSRSPRGRTRGNAPAAPPVKAGVPPTHPRDCSRSILSSNPSGN